MDFVLPVFGFGQGNLNNEGGAAASRGRGAGALRTAMYETHISAIAHPPEAPARVSGPQIQQERTGHPRQSPPSGPQTADSGVIEGPVMASDSSTALGLPRQRRIKQGRDFQRVKGQGQRVAEGCLILNWLTLPAGRLARIGIITGRKLGGAVVRSRARRLLRESFRRHQQDLAEPLDLVLVARPSIVGKRYGDVEHDFLKALRRARLLRARPGADAGHAANDGPGAATPEGPPQ
jgi:ribonuclease P protein component